MDTTQCPICAYPLEAPTYEGQQLYCPYCKTISTAIGVEIPNAVFVGFVCFFAGVLFGPAVHQAIQGASDWMRRQARERIQ